MSIENSHFSFYEYHNKIIALLNEGFEILADGDVVFMPSEDGEVRKYENLAMPAFVMSWGAIEPIRKGVPMRDLEQNGRLERSGGGNINDIDVTDLQYYMPIKVNLTGVLVMPKFPTDAMKDGVLVDINPDDLNPLLMLHQAATNVAALIYAAARGWNCSEPVIESIEYEPLDDYEAMRIDWSHKAIVGREDSCPVNLNDLFRQWRLLCPREGTLVFEGNSEEI